MKRAVVLLSGGIDSTTTLAIAIAEGYETYALSFDYGQRHQIETKAARRVANSLGAKDHRIAKSTSASSAAPRSRTMSMCRSSVPKRDHRRHPDHIRPRTQHHLSRLRACLGGSDSG